MKETCSRRLLIVRGSCSPRVGRSGAEFRGCCLFPGAMGRCGAVLRRYMTNFGKARYFNSPISFSSIGSHVGFKADKPRSFASANDCHDIQRRLRAPHRSGPGRGDWRPSTVPYRYPVPGLSRGLARTVLSTGMSLQTAELLSHGYSERIEPEASPPQLRSPEPARASQAFVENVSHGDVEGGVLGPPHPQVG